MRYPFHPADGYAITLDDLAAFVTEMKEHHQLPGTTVVRTTGVLEVDFVSGPRIARLTADTDPDDGSGSSLFPPANRAQRRGAAPRRPRR